MKGEDRQALYTTYINIILYALCYQLQRPIEPFLIQSLISSSSTPTTTVNETYGRLNSFFSAIQTIGSPLVGMLLDRIGIRMTSAMVYLSSALSYLILANANSMTALFASKIPTALQHAFLVAQATAACSTGGDEKGEEDEAKSTTNRARALARMTTAYTIGATVGPALGGYLATPGNVVEGVEGDLYRGARWAVVGSLVSVVISLLFLSDASSSSNAEKRSADSSPSPKSFVSQLQNSVSIALRCNLWPLLLVKIITGIASSIHSTALPLILSQQLNFDPSQLGIGMSIASFSVALFGAVGVSPLVSTFGVQWLARVGLVFRGVSSVIAAIVITAAAAAAALSTATVASSRLVRDLAAVSVIHALSSHALATSLTTRTTGSVTVEERGALLGLEHGLFAIARIAGPALGTAILSAGYGGKKVGGGSFWSIALTCLFIDLGLVNSLLMYHDRAMIRRQRLGGKVAQTMSTSSSNDSISVRSKNKKKDDYHSD
mmetsp:Transcript_42956/g.64748  ORF Transcript_42956/g.64748 Transcript_42956/m.64748 type:complete len:492 (-) Transcript_42956:555-2030(-)